ncbi:MAG: hypothetical protein N4A49_03255 [Marinifilaceae bacterium]|jgi:hypothetical protein|nr:hypothetical protein [Marinifilaceae bacterium]
MQKQYTLIFLILISVFVFSCDKGDDYEYSSSVKFDFNTDSIKLGRIFTEYKSLSYIYKIYNTNSKKIKIDSLSLTRKDNELIIYADGQNIYSNKNIIINGNDSLFIILKQKFPYLNKDQERKYENNLIINYNQTKQSIPISARIQDTYSLKQDINTPTTLKANRPYIVENKIKIKSSLNIEKGSQLYFTKNAGFEIMADFIANGDRDNKTIFSSYRQDSIYRDVPGQWEGLLTSSETKTININHVIIENGKHALKSINEEENNNAIYQINNCIIRNNSDNAIDINGGELYMTNSLNYNCGGNCIRIYNLSKTNITHTTIANYWTISFNNKKCINIENSNNINIINSIIWGNNYQELELGESDYYLLQNSLIKGEESRYTAKNCIFNLDPEFVNQYDNSFELLEESPCINSALKINESKYGYDLNNNKREELPDIGAFEYIGI